MNRRSKGLEEGRIEEEERKANGEWGKKDEARKGVKEIKQTTKPR